MPHQLLGKRQGIRPDHDFVVIGLVAFGQKLGVTEFVIGRLFEPIENVFTGSVLCRAMDATTRLESRPPLKNAPKGTSAIMRIRTLSSNSSHSSAQASLPRILRALVRPEAATSNSALVPPVRPIS